MLGGQRFMDLRFLDGTDGDFITELLDPAVYRGYLQVMSRFNSYSWRNVFHIFKQMPLASKLADFNTWKEQYGRSIILGSKSIKILVPVPQKPKKTLAEKTDPSTGTAALDEHGKRIMEEITVELPVQFKKHNMIDISQTEGSPVLILAGDVMTDETLRGVFDDVLKSMLSADAEQIGYCETIRKIVVERLAGLESIDSDKIGFITASVIFVVLRRFVIETEMDEIDLSDINIADADVLAIIGKQADGLITEIEDRFAVACKERGLDPMTEIKPAEVKPPKIEPETVSAVKPKAEPQYSTELHTDIIAGVEFSKYAVKPLTEEKAADIQDSTPPHTKPETSPTQIIQSIPKEPFEPPVLKHPPDTSITITDRNQYGYTRPELLPLNKYRALSLFRRDMTVYMLHKDNTETMARYFSDIQNHIGIFGIAYGV
jgi:hypothetical protein